MEKADYAKIVMMEVELGFIDPHLYQSIMDQFKRVIARYPTWKELYDIFCQIGDTYERD